MFSKKTFINKSILIYGLGLSENLVLNIYQIKAQLQF